MKTHGSVRVRGKTRRGDRRRRGAGGNSGSEIDPYSQQPLSAAGPTPGEARGAYAAEYRSDPLGNARSLPATVARERGRTQSTLARGRESVASARVANREQVQDGFTARQADLRADKREELGRRIRQQAGLPRPLARWTHEEVGGLLRNTARIATSLGSAVGSASDAATSFARTLADTKDPVAAWKAGGDAFTAEAKQAIGLRTDQLKGEHHLTDEQVALYRGALNSVAPDATGLQDMIGSEVSQARANLVAREGPLGEPMAELILRAASSEDDGGLRLIGAYNDAKDPGQVSVGTITTDPPPNGPPQASSGSARAGQGTFRSKGEQAYGPQIVAMARAHGVDPAFALAVARQESNFDQNAVSPKGAVGLMQLMPATAERFGVSDRSDPEQNIRGGVRYLEWLSEQFDGDPSLVAAGYNAGKGAVAKYGNQVPPYAETREYVERVAQHRAAYLRRLG